MRRLSILALCLSACVLGGGALRVHDLGADILGGDDPRAADARDITFVSPATHVQLVELYTSQGCSSCPPAESWLGNWKENEQLWENVVPIAFHVDYWNRLGWTDPFSHSDFTRRQRRYANVWGHPTVYTPGFVVDGHPWRGWFEGSPLPAVQDSSGVLSLHWDGESADVRFQPNPATLRPSTAHIALLTMGQPTQIAAGENRGREMSADFVVVDLEETGMHKQDGEWRGRVSLQAEERQLVKAIVGWVTARPQGTVLQAAGGWVTP